MTTARDKALDDAANLCLAIMTNYQNLASENVGDARRNYRIGVSEGAERCFNAIRALKEEA